MSKSILIRVTNDEGYDDVAPELMMEDVIGNPAGGWAFELVQEVRAVSWQAQAYAKLGHVRDMMTPEDVRTVQQFIGSIPEQQSISAASQRSSEEKP